MNFGVCWGCGKTISFDKVPVCNDCDLKYIAQIKEFVKNNNNKVTREQLVYDSNILPQSRMNKYIEYLIKEEVLKFGENGIDVEEKEDNSEIKRANNKRELLQNFQSQLREEKAKMNSDKNNNIGNGMYTNYRR